MTDDTTDGDSRSPADRPIWAPPDAAPGDTSWWSAPQRPGAEPGAGSGGATPGGTTPGGTTPGGTAPGGADAQPVWAKPDSPWGPPPPANPQAPWGAPPPANPQAPWGAPPPAAPQSPWGPLPPSPGYAGDPGYGPPPGDGRRRGPLFVIAIVVVVLVVAAAIGFALVDTSRHTTNASGAAASAPASAAPVQPSTPPPSSASPPGSTGSTGSPPPAAAQNGPLDSYLLPPSALGPGTQMVLLAGGRSVTDQATLDFCNDNYSSEHLRAQRVQVGYAGENVDASNEFVKYRPGGTAKAWTEIQQAIKACPSTFRQDSSVVDQIQSTTQVSGLVDHHVMVTFRSSGTGLAGPTVEWSTAVYQFDGDYFSGVYVYGADRNQVVTEAETLARTSATLLREAAAGKPGTGGGPMVTQGAGNGDNGTQT